MSEQIFLTQLPENYNFPASEEETVKYWNVNKIYKKTVEKNINNPTYNAIDGPPFVSGALHHGHCHIGMMKSSNNNYWTMKGYNVLNKIGYDVHGLPSELNANREIGLRTNQDVKKYGIGNYNTYCVNMINDMMGSWHPTFDRIGRFFDKTNEYKTMDLNFMESTWWIWNSLWNKGLIYRGYKILPYSIECGTSLSSSEATGEEVYKDVTDLSVYVKFALKDKVNTYFIAWTTTPWTLPSNLALAVNSKLKYVTILDKKTSSYYIVSENSLNRVYPPQIGDIRPFEIVNSFLGSELKDIEYVPIFPYYNERTFKDVDSPKPGLFKVLIASFVDDSSGTGIVHIAPSFGSEDFDLCIAEKIVSIEEIGKYCPIDENGYFTEKVTDFSGQKIFDANKKIIEMLSKQGKVVRKENYRHRYPHCWRTDTPLISKAVSSFFVKVSSLREKLVKNNEKVKWIPENIGSGRFKNWIENASDWGVSRTRFFGTPIPVWISDDGEEMISIGSVQELCDLTGMTKLENIHLHHVKDILIPSRQGKGMLKHCQDVMDCWFESAAVPIAQYHYPFENKELVDEIIKTGYLSELVCEGADQCNKWFYVLSVLSTALFDIPAYKHVICNGLILAPDGQKFSKRLANFVPPMTVCNKIGADALRMYFIGSPASHGSSFQFKEEKIEQINFKYFQWLNGVKFFVEHHTKYCKDGNTFSLKSYLDSSKVSENPLTRNVTDSWILSRVGKLIENIDDAMSNYLFYKVKLEIMDFIEDLVNWYIKFNRNRFRGRYCDVSEQGRALSTLYRVLVAFSRIAAPFAPFLSETLYGTLKPLLGQYEESVHLCSYPTSTDFPSNPEVLRRMKRLQLVVGMVRSLRSKSTHFQSAKVPIKSVLIVHEDDEFLDDLKIFEKYLYEDLNSISIQYSTHIDIKYKIEPNVKLLGATFKKLANLIKQKLKSLTQNEIKNYLASKDNNSIVLKLNSADIENEDLVVDGSMFDVVKDEAVQLGVNELGMTEQGCVVVLNATYDDEVIELYLMRLFIGAVQKMRKNTNLRPWNKIGIYYETNSPMFIKAITDNILNINEQLLYEVKFGSSPNEEKIVATHIETLNGYSVSITITDQYSKQ